MIRVRGWVGVGGVLRLLVLSSPQVWIRSRIARTQSARPRCIEPDVSIVQVVDVLSSRIGFHGMLLERFKLSPSTADGDKIYTAPRLHAHRRRRKRSPLTLSKSVRFRDAPGDYATSSPPDGRTRSEPREPLLARSATYAVAAGPVIGRLEWYKGPRGGRDRSQPRGRRVGRKPDGLEARRKTPTPRHPFPTMRRKATPARRKTRMQTPSQPAARTAGASVRSTGALNVRLFELGLRQIRRVRYADGSSRGRRQSAKERWRELEHDGGGSDGGYDEGCLVASDGRLNLCVVFRLVLRKDSLVRKVCISGSGRRRCSSSRNEMHQTEHARSRSFWCISLSENVGVTNEMHWSSR